MDQPSWMQDGATATAAAPAQPAARQTNNTGGSAGAAVRSGVHFVNMGLCVLMAFSAVIGVLRIQDAAVVDFFLGVYLFFFAVLLFAYEVLRLMPSSRFEEMMHRNFGWFYGNRGRGFYMIFIGFLNFPLGKPVPLITGIVCLCWGVLCVAVSFYKPEWFDSEKGT